MRKTGKIVLNNALKIVSDDYDRIISPKKTIEIIKKRLRSFGLNILNKTVRIDKGRLGIPVFFSVCGSNANEVIGTRKQMGKGVTADQAEASAIMELVERYSFFSFYKNSQNTKIDTYKNLFKNAISFDLIAKSVNDESDDFEISKKIFQTIPLKWTGAYNITTGREIFIPLDWFYFINEFNGSSSGNCVEEALCQGMCEVVERHVSSLISQKKLNTPFINFKSIDVKSIRSIVNKYLDIGVKLLVTDFTMGVGIPSVGVLAYDPVTFPKKSEIIWTAGTATDPKKALIRALTEVAQLAGDFISSSNYVASGLPKFNSVEEFDFIMTSHDNLDIADLPDISNINIRFEIDSCVSAIQDQNMETIVVDMTHSGLMVPTFYTIIPGACFRERAVGGNVAMFLTKIIFETFPIKIAISKLTDIDKMLPGKYFIQFYIGKCYLKFCKYEIAVSYFLKALEMNPNNQDLSTIYSYLGVCFKDLGHYNDALEVLNKGESVDSARVDIYNLKGYCHFKLKNYERSIKNFKKVIKLNPGSAIDYANIASNYRDMGRKNEAIYYYKIALELDPTIDFAFQNLNILMRK